MPMRGFREDDSEDQPLHILIGPVNFERIISFFFCKREKHTQNFRKIKEKNAQRILEKSPREKLKELC